jgi:hypothetical protein
VYTKPYAVSGTCDADRPNGSRQDLCVAVDQKDSLDSVTLVRELAYPLFAIALLSTINLALGLLLSSDWIHVLTILI